jgi:hypothetical protein
MNYYNEAFEIADALAAEGLVTESESIRDAIESSSTATEILMRLRWQMQQIHAVKTPILLDTRRRIESLTAALDRELAS